jgi:hypothetical protein
MNNILTVQVIQRHQYLSDDDCGFGILELSAFVFNKGEEITGR